MAKDFKTPWKDSLGIDFGLAPNPRDDHSGADISARCKFCDKVGREEVEVEAVEGGRKRRHTVYVKSFDTPFRVDNIKVPLECSTLRHGRSTPNSLLPTRSSTSTLLTSRIESRLTSMATRGL
jgi:hypothetical protein